MKKLTVLLGDHDEVIYDIIVDVFETFTENEYDLNVLTAFHDDDLFKLAETNPIDIFILYLNNIYSDGNITTASDVFNIRMELISLFNTRYQKPVIALCGLDGYAGHSEDAGAIAFFKTPFSIVDFQMEIDECMKRIESTTMTIQKADSILKIVCEALQERSSPIFHPISALRGYDVFQIDIAIKLLIANEFLILANEEDFEEQFLEGIKLYSPIPLHIVTLFVADDELDKLKLLELGSREFKQCIMEIEPSPLDSSTNTFKDSRFSSLETPSSFGDYCKYVGVNDSNYWQKIHARIGLDYRSESPQKNKPELLGNIDLR